MKVFKEEQRFTQIWLIILLTISLCTTIAIMLNEYLKQGSSFNSKEFLITFFSIVLSVSFIFFLKLRTRIDEIGIHYQFFPFHFKTRVKKWEDIKSVCVRKYEPISEYGGWGVHKSLFNKEKGIAINVAGNIGIQLVLKNNKKLLIGTQKESDVKRILETYKSKLL